MLFHAFDFMAVNSGPSEWFPSSVQSRLLPISFATSAIVVEEKGKEKEKEKQEKIVRIDVKGSGTKED